MKPLVVASLTLLLFSCAQVTYTAYSGRQQNWPVASGAFVQTKYGLPVYYGTPDRKYSVLGYMEIDAPVGTVVNTQAHIDSAVSEARKHGADALILLESNKSVAGFVSSNSAFANTSGSTVLLGNTAYHHSTTSGWGFGTTAPMLRGHARAVAIKFI
jgi:hypothetical protein